MQLPEIATSSEARRLRSTSRHRSLAEAHSIVQLLLIPEMRCLCFNGVRSHAQVTQVHRHEPWQERPGQAKSETGPALNVSKTKCCPGDPSSDSLSQPDGYRDHARGSGTDPLASKLRTCIYYTTETAALGAQTSTSRYTGLWSDASSSPASGSCLTGHHTPPPSTGKSLHT
jgi:hypothetical protein